MSAAHTPMMAQYQTIKAGVTEGVLLAYRMGDFYEFFFDDAEIIADALEIALTRRGKHQGALIPMCGIPVHSSERYFAFLLGLGRIVAVCEVTEPDHDFARRRKPNTSEVPRREILRLIDSPSKLKLKVG